MSRKSRGITVTNPRPAVTPVCPSSGSTVLDSSDPDNWTCIYNWSPDVLVGTFQQWYQVNGTGWILDQSSVNRHSGVEIDNDPHGFADSGDFLEFKAICSDVGGCGDFETNPQGATLP